MSESPRPGTLRSANVCQKSPRAVLTGLLVHWQIVFGITPVPSAKKARRSSSTLGGLVGVGVGVALPVGVTVGVLMAVSSPYTARPVIGPKVTDGNASTKVTDPETAI